MWAVFKRFFWFFAVNILIVLTISVLASLLGVGKYVTAYGLDYTKLFAYCLLWGMTGSFISLGLSRILAKWTMGIQLLDAHSSLAHEKELVRIVYGYAQKAGLKTMPQVGIYASPELNAFATGPTKNRSLVAVSTGLLNGMSNSELEGVIAHEIAHVANGDMVTMTLVQGVVNTFVLFFSKILAFFIGQSVKEENRRTVELFVSIGLQIVLGILGSIVVAWFSRYREFRADNGGASLAGKEKMIAALAKLQRTYGLVDEKSHTSVATMKISGRNSKFMKLFSTHPPLEDRIAALRGMQSL
jgi:heat shock protein HtpX